MIQQRFKRIWWVAAIPLLGSAASTNAQTEKVYPRPDTPSAALELQFCDKASKVIGAKVRNPQGEDLGKIEELVMNPSSGAIAYAVVSFGGFLGMGDKLFAVPFSALNPEAFSDQKDPHFTINVDKAKLEKAPGFPKNNWPDIQAPEWGSEIDKYYGFSRATDASSAIDENKVFRLYKVSELIGKNVHNATGDELGEIKELAIDPRAGRIVYFVLSSGGFLGMGNKLFALPWEALKLTPEGDKEKWVVQITKDRFEKAPVYDEDQWERMSDPAWVTEVYRHYGYRPYWSTTEAGYKKADENK